MSDVSEHETDLVRRAADGDVVAYEALYRSNVGRVHALCLRMARNQADAEDLTQQVFVRVWEKLGTFRGESAFSTWLHRVAVNVVIAEVRRQGRWREHLGVMAASADSGNYLPAFSVGGDIDLERAIATLSPRARLIFMLHDIEGYKHREIADLTGIAVGTSKAHLHRARRRLREELSI